MSGRQGFERQMLVTKDKAELRAIVDGLEENDIAILMVRRREERDDQLQIVDYGEGKQTEFLGLLGYGTVMMHRTYFADED